MAAKSANNKWHLICIFNTEKTLSVYTQCFLAFLGYFETTEVFLLEALNRKARYFQGSFSAFPTSTPPFLQR